MSAVIAALHTFWASWGPWITVGLVPTIIAGLSVSPKTQPEAAWLQRQWDSIKSILQYFSVATFSDHPGTFKLPLTKSGRIKNKGSGTSTGTGPGACAAVILAGFISMQHTGCCSLSHSCSKSDTTGQIATNTIDCGIAAIQSQSSRLLPFVMAILTSNKPDWQTELDSLKQAGADAFICALQSASLMMLDGSKPAENEKMSASPLAMSQRAALKEAHNKAEQYYATVGKTTINVKH